MMFGCVKITFLIFLFGVFLSGCADDRGKPPKNVTLNMYTIEDNIFVEFRNDRDKAIKYYNPFEEDGIPQSNSRILIRKPDGEILSRTVIEESGWWSPYFLNEEDVVFTIPPTVYTLGPNQSILRHWPINRTADGLYKENFEGLRADTPIEVKLRFSFCLAKRWHVCFRRETEWIARPLSWLDLNWQNPRKLNIRNPEED